MCSLHFRCGCRDRDVKESGLENWIEILRMERVSRISLVFCYFQRWSSASKLFIVSCLFSTRGRTRNSSESLKHVRRFLYGILVFIGWNKIFCHSPFSTSLSDPSLSGIVWILRCLGKSITNCNIQLRKYQFT